MNRSVKNTIAESLFLDANVLLEIILARHHQKAARKLIETQSRSGNLYISALTAHLVVHFGQNVVDLPTLRKFLADYTVLSLEPADFEWAFVNVRGQDFEDALQLAAAVRNGCSEFITLDKELAGAYKSLSSIKVKLLD